MTKTTQKVTRLFFKCQPCDKFNGRDRTYTRSYDLVAHLVNTHDLYPVSIKHNATYLPLKSDLRPATAEEVLKYKDANKHGRKRTPGAVLTGEATASGTTLESEVVAGPSKEHGTQKTKEELPSTSEKGGKRDRGRVTKTREDKEPREDAGREDARKAKETADEKDAAEDEADKKEYLVLQNKMEARRLAREIKTARDTLASLRAEQEDVSAKAGEVPEASVEGEKTREGNEPASVGGNKKSRAIRPAVRASVGDPGTTTTTEVSRRAEEREKAKVMKAGEEQQLDRVAGQKKGADKPVAKRQKTAIESSRKTATTVHLSDEDPRTEALGPALVAGALGRKIGDARTTKMMRGITECRVELLSTRQKAKLPVPAAPHNSGESNNVADVSNADDARLSLSATDLHVHVGLPGDVIEMASEIVSPRVGDNENRGGLLNVEPRRVSLISVAVPPCDRLSREVDQTNEEIQSAEASEHKLCSDGLPTGLGESSTLASERVIMKSSTGIRETLETGKAECRNEGIEGDAIGSNEKRRVLRDIEIAIAMREHLAVTNPDLAMAASLIGAVRGQPHTPKDKATEEVIKASGKRSSKVDVSPSTARAPESMDPTATVPSAKGRETGSRYRGGGDVESDSEPETTDVVVVEDTERSGGETSGNESSSGSSSESSSSSSRHSLASRKRAADESLERAHRGTGRQPFPGATTRGTGGCRVHLPTRETAECAAIEELRANRESTTVVREVASLESAGLVKSARTKTITGATANQTATIARDIPFVTINAAVRIPAQLLTPPQPRASKNENEREVMMEVVREAATTRTTSDGGTSTTINPTNEWGDTDL